MEKTVIFEGMTSISAIFHGIDQGINDRRILRVLFDREKLSKKQKEYRFLQAQAAAYGFPIDLTDEKTLDELTTGKTHGGIIAYCSERALPSLTDAMSTADGIFSKKDGFFFMLEGIEDPYNFGYTLRSLYAAGVDGIILTPRNWMEVAGIVSKSSAGASEQLPMAIADAEQAVCLMKEKGVRIVCAGIRDSVSVTEADLRAPLLMIVGGEKRGISSSVLRLSDQIVRIDYGREFRGSLSTASAATVLAFEVLRNQQK
jgi:23S rRNA (guanosine2251-2'-O)-methyltransferase